MKDLLLVGGGGHCKAVIDVVEQASGWRIIGIIERPEAGLNKLYGYPVLGDDSQLEELYCPGLSALVTVGQIKSAAIRVRLFQQLKQIGYVLPTVISPHAYVSPRAVIGAGTIIMHYSVVGPSVQIGENVILNTRSILEHDVSVGKHCHISTSAVVNGGVKIGDEVFVGSGSVCREGVTIGRGALVGMGARVRDDVSPASLVY